MSKFLAATLLVDMLLAPTNKLFTSPSRLIFQYRGITTAVPIIIDNTEVHLDVHIYPIVGFNILQGYLLEEL